MTGGEWITFAQVEVRVEAPVDGSLEKWVCSRSRPAASWAAARARCQAAGCALPASLSLIEPVAQCRT